MSITSYDLFSGDASFWKKYIEKQGFQVEFVKKEGPNSSAAEINTTYATEFVPRTTGPWQKEDLVEEFRTTQNGPKFVQKGNAEIDAAYSTEFTPLTSGQNRDLN